MLFKHYIMTLIFNVYIYILVDWEGGGSWNLVYLRNMKGNPNKAVGC